MSSAVDTGDLTSLPEIGRVTAEELVAVGIPDAATLRALGPREAFRRIRDRLDPGACVQLLWGLAAAVEGVPVKELDPGVKAELRLWRSAETPSPPTDYTDFTADE